MLSIKNFFEVISARAFIYCLVSNYVFSAAVDRVEAGYSSTMGQGFTWFLIFVSAVMIYLALWAQADKTLGWYNGTHRGGL